jgi:Ca-activated chloride channel family protein
VVFPSVKEENDVIATLWARTKISYLSDEMYHGSDPDIEGEITEIALRYRIMSSYTSFVAVSEEVRNVDGKLVRVDVPIPMPEGVSYEGVFGADEGEAMYFNGGGAGRAYKYSAAPKISGGTTTCQEALLSPDYARDKDDVEGLISFDTPTVLGGLEADDVLNALESIEDELADIYEKYLKKDASLEGRLVLGITLKADGSVESVAVKSSTLDNDKMEKAVADEVKKLRFVASDDGGKVVITAAIRFET